MKKRIIPILTVLSLLFLSACVSASNNTDGTSVTTQKERDLATSPINVRLGLAYLQRGELPRAKEKLLLAVKQNPRSDTALDALAYYWEVTGDIKQADTYYLAAIKLAPNSGRALNNYGAFLCRDGQYKKAETYLLAAAREETYVNTAAAYENAALCELGVPNIKKAEYYFKRALDQDPNRPTSYYELAKLYYGQGKYTLANEYITGYSTVGNPSPRTLWLAIQIAQKVNDVNAILKNGALLAKKFPNSKQAKEYQKLQLS